MNPSLQPYLARSAIIDWDHPLVASQAAALAEGAASDEAVARRCYEFVRDAIRHSWDFRQNPVTCRASEVLIHGAGYCFAKSHLLAALLRANGIPAGLCYQRLRLEADGPRHCLHGLNAVHLAQYGWYRVDPRGNKPGVDAAFTPPVERLAFPLALPTERDLPEIWPEPLPAVVAALTLNVTVEQVYARLPDIEVI